MDLGGDGEEFDVGVEGFLKVVPVGLVVDEDDLGQEVPGTPSGQDRRQGWRRRKGEEGRGKDRLMTEWMERRRVDQASLWKTMMMEAAGISSG